MSGFVLKLARQSTALTQEQLAESLAVDVSTVAGWESGRRPLAAMHAGEFLRLSGRLTRLGAPAATGRHLREAVEADHVIGVGVTTATATADLDGHPLAAGVHRRTTTNLITWPLTGRLPQHLQAYAPAVRRRGPTPSGPVLHPEERVRFLDHLLAVAQQSIRPGQALLRRQAVYLLGFDTRPHVVEWLRGEEHRASHRTPAPGDLAGLLEARSATVALASAGDPSRLSDFVAHTTTDGRAELVNLNYWAYWIGEYPDEHSDDGFMLDDTRSWTGTRLLAHLVHRLAPDAPHLPLNLHTLHALIAARPSLLDRTAVRVPLGDALDRLGAVAGQSRSVREQIAGLHYALRITDR